MIEVKALGKRFGVVQAVDGVSFRAEDGRVTGLGRTARARRPR